MLIFKLWLFIIEPLLKENTKQKETQNDDDDNDFWMCARLKRELKINRNILGI